MKTNCILALAGKMNHDLTLEHPVGQNVYALSQQYGDDIWYRAKVLRSRQVRGDRAYFVHFYGCPSCEDEWIDELDTIPVYKIDRGGVFTLTGRKTTTRKTTGSQERYRGIEKMKLVVRKT